jgi:Domain of unknown function (DUF5753)
MDSATSSAAPWPNSIACSISAEHVAGLGRTGLKPSEVERLLDLYGVVDPERSQLIALAHDATQKGWWEDYADAIADPCRTFIGLETEATSVSHWEVDVVPGLLQTEQYATQVRIGYQNVLHALLDYAWSGCSGSRR